MTTNENLSSNETLSQNTNSEPLTSNSAGSIEEYFEAKYISPSDLEKLRTLLEKKRPQIQNNKRKASTLGQIGLWEELEQLYKNLEQRERDYQIAVQIGKMLLDRNQFLQEEILQLAKQLELQEENLKQSEKMQNFIKESEITRKEYELKIKHLTMEIEHLKQQQINEHQVVSNLNSNENKIQKLLVQVHTHKKKNSELVEEIESFKLELEESQKEQKKILKKLKEKGSENLKNSSNSIEKQEEAIVINRSEKDIKLIEQIKEENLYLKELLNQKNIEQENSCYLIDASKQEILNLKKQNEEQLLLLEEKSNRILSLQNQIEELMILNSRPKFQTNSLKVELSKVEKQNKDLQSTFQAIHKKLSQSFISEKKRKGKYSSKNSRTSSSTEDTFYGRNSIEQSRDDLFDFLEGVRKGFSAWMKTDNEEENSETPSPREWLQETSHSQGSNSSHSEGRETSKSLLEDPHEETKKEFDLQISVSNYSFLDERREEDDYRFRPSFDKSFSSWNSDEEDYI